MGHLGGLPEVRARWQPEDTLPTLSPSPRVWQSPPTLRAEHRCGGGGCSPDGLEHLPKGKEVSAGCPGAQGSRAGEKAGTLSQSTAAAPSLAAGSQRSLLFTFPTHLLGVTPIHVTCHHSPRTLESPLCVERGGGFGEKAPSSEDHAKMETQLKD